MTPFTPHNVWEGEVDIASRRSADSPAQTQELLQNVEWYE